MTCNVLLYTLMYERVIESRVVLQAILCSRIYIVAMANLTPFSFLPGRGRERYSTSSSRRIVQKHKGLITSMLIASVAYRSRPDLGMRPRTRTSKQARKRETTWASYSSQLSCPNPTTSHAYSDRMHLASPKPIPISISHPRPASHPSP